MIVVACLENKIIILIVKNIDLSFRQIKHNKQYSK